MSKCAARPPAGTVGSPLNGSVQPLKAGDRVGRDAAPALARLVAELAAENERLRADLAEWEAAGRSARYEEGGR